ncbi:AbrB/MazE/SpoVT family DNA-binding domain-containing protein [Candidatus Micrarchaeota archaeon]|nr:AbrB/MazE/SpoVT family DNA-binding domain-containing protein [Candidatus Micrarchaeota archaeon]
MESIEDVVTVSPKYQVVVPKKFREQLQLKKGEKMKVRIEKSRLVLERIPPFEEFYGKFPGLDKAGPSIRQMRKESDGRLDRY